jgi:hypothetical protein
MPLARYVCHAERSLFTRERSDGLYTTFTSLAGKMFDELIINALAAAPVTAASFYVIQLQGNFGLFYLIYFMTLCVGVGECVHNCTTWCTAPCLQHGLA